ncbi:MAG: hypothetical protein JKY92_04775 [Magnetovibrio sp.]|nr:hypothetical protein [Magnetovibrio sp.]
MPRPTRTVREVKLFKDKKPKEKNHTKGAFVLSFRSLAKAGFEGVFTNIVAMVLILWLPILVSVAVAYGRLHVFETTPFVILQGLDFLLKLWLSSSVIIAIHRSLLLSEKPAFPGFKFARRERNAWLCNVAIMGRVLFAMALPLALMYAAVWAMDNYPEYIWWRVMMAVFGFVFLAASFLALDVYIRLLFALPTVALDIEGSLKDRLDDALEFGSGYAMTLFAAFCLVAITFGVLMFALSFVPDTASFGLKDVLIQVAGWVYFAIVTAMYATAYKAIKKERAKDSKA